MSSQEDKTKHQQRRRSHITKDLHSRKYHQKMRPHKTEDDAERRFRKYKDVKEVGLAESTELAEELNKKFNKDL